MENVWVIEKRLMGDTRLNNAEKLKAAIEARLVTSIPHWVNTTIHVKLDWNMDKLFNGLFVLKIFAHLPIIFKCSMDLNLVVSLAVNHNDITLCVIHSL